MGFQTTVPNELGFGNLGELAYDGPQRAESVRLNSSNAANNVLGRALFFVSGSEGVVQAGGSGLVFAGILMSPKEQVLRNGLGNSNVLPNGEQVEALRMGEVVVQLPAAFNVGDVIYSTNADGVLTSTAPGAAAPGSSTLIPNARVTRYSSAAAGLAVIQLTY